MIPNNRYYTTTVVQRKIRIWGYYAVWQPPWRLRILNRDMVAD